MQQYIRVQQTTFILQMVLQDSFHTVAIIYKRNTNTGVVIYPILGWGPYSYANVELKLFCCICLQLTLTKGVHLSFIRNFALMHGGAVHVFTSPLEMDIDSLEVPINRCFFTYNEADVQPPDWEVIVWM